MPRSILGSLKRWGLGMIHLRCTRAVLGAALVVVQSACAEQVCQEREVPEDWQGSYPGDLPEERKLNGCDVVQGTLEPVAARDVSWNSDREDYWIDMTAGMRVTAYITDRDSDGCSPELKWKLNLFHGFSDDQPPREDGCPQVTETVSVPGQYTLYIHGTSTEAHPYDLHIEVEE